MWTKEEAELLVLNADTNLIATCNTCDMLFGDISKKKIYWKTKNYEVSRVKKFGVFGDLNPRVVQALVDHYKEVSLLTFNSALDLGEGEQTRSLLDTTTITNIIHYGVYDVNLQDLKYGEQSGGRSRGVYASMLYHNRVRGIQGEREAVESLIQNLKKEVVVHIDFRVLHANLGGLTFNELNYVLEEVGILRNLVGFSLTSYAIADPAVVAKIFRKLVGATLFEG